MQTDASGRFCLENLCTEERVDFPADRPPVVARRWSLVCQDAQRDVTPGEGEELRDIELVVKDAKPWAGAEWTLSGRVVDAETSKPLWPFRVMTRDAKDSGASDDAYGEHLRAAGGPGLYRLAWRPESGLQIRIEAVGYEPFVSPVLFGREREQCFDATLKPTTGILGVVSAQGGTRVANAEVVLHRLSEYVVIYSGRPNRDSGTVVRSDGQGRFVLPAQPDDRYVVMAFADEGFAEVSARELRGNPEIVLRPWARVEGEYSVGNALQSGREMILDGGEFLRSGSSESVQLSWQYSTRTDANGSFVFERVFPAESCQVGAVVQSGGVRWSSHSEHVKLASGRTSHVRVGGRGRPVTGRLVSNDLTPPEWNEVFVEVRAKLPMVALPAEGKTGDSQALLDRSFYTLVGPDGSFRIEDVTPGDYGLELFVRAMERTSLARRQFSVPPMESERSDNPLDLGEIRVRSHGSGAATYSVGASGQIVITHPSDDHK